MFKNFKKIAYFSLCFMIVFLFTSCFSKSGVVYSLDNLVTNNIISEDNLKNIAALRNGSLQVVHGNNQGILNLETIDYVVAPISDDLSNELRNDILKDFKIYAEERFQSAQANYKITSSEIVAYFGTYNDYTVVEITFSLSGIDISGESSNLIVSDYYLGQIAGNHMVIAWRKA